MGRAQNDATALIVLQLIPEGNYYIRNVLYINTFEGEHSGVITMKKIKQLFEEFECDYIVMDTASAGMSIYDRMVEEQVDIKTGIIYPAYSCLNDTAMAMRCKVNNAPKVIYSVKADKTFNTQSAIGLRDDIARNKTRLLIPEEDAREFIEKEFQDLSMKLKADLLVPYVQTTLLINEMVNLDYEANNRGIKLTEQSGARKDRYSALAYANYFADTLERKTKKRLNNNRSREVKIPFRQPKISSL